nr:hypothetical protein BaRGS_014757 [Batillaria attramentaria]
MSRMNESEAVALLQHLSKEDLQHLLNETQSSMILFKIFHRLVRSLQSEHDNLVAQNKSLAEYNLSLQPRLDTLKTQVATDYERANTLKDTFVGDQKLDTIHALLQTEAATAEEDQK